MVEFYYNFQLRGSHVRSVKQKSLPCVKGDGAPLQSSNFTSSPGKGDVAKFKLY
ncbi:hypothetical protein IMSAG013_01295 [Clostridiales bacterium]|nr:hypothetical protein IMSAG013_01295 [Clostridiales bacterium]